MVLTTLTFCHALFIGETRQADKIFIGETRMADKIFIGKTWLADKIFVGEISRLTSLRPKTTGFGRADCEWSKAVR